MKEKFTWIPMYKELSDWLERNQCEQEDLIDILKGIGITGVKDRAEGAKYEDLTELDPFTFLSYLNKFHSDITRVDLLRKLRKELQLQCQEPEDVSGIPTTHPMKVHLFPSKLERRKDIEILWKLFIQVKNGNVDESLFQSVLRIKSVGKGKLSIVLFYVNPDKFVPLDSNTVAYLRRKKLKYTYDSFHSYVELSKQVVDDLNKKPWEISYAAYNETPESESKEIRNLKDLFNNLEHNLESDDSYCYYYRGHSDKEYSLIPSIYRKKELITNENRIFKDIIAQNPSDFKGCASTFEKLVKMQHYSVPTRLLDITTNPLVALYFACLDDEKDGKLFRFEIKTSEIKYYDSDAVSVVSNIAKRPVDFSIEDIRDEDCDTFNDSAEIAYLLHEIKAEKPHFQNGIDSKDIERVFCVKPLMDNPRIIRQSGAFFLFGIDGEKEQPAALKYSYKTYLIRKDNKKKIRKQLEALGIDEGTLFPEIEHVAEQVKSKYNIC